MHEAAQLQTINVCHSLLINTAYTGVPILSISKMDDSRIMINAQHLEPVFLIL